MQHWSPPRVNSLEFPISHPVWVLLLIAHCLLLPGQLVPTLSYLCIPSTYIVSLSLLPPPLLYHRPLFLSHAFLILLSPHSSLSPALCVLCQPTDSILLLVPTLPSPWLISTHLHASPVQFPHTASSDITLEDSLLPYSPSPILVVVLVPSEFKSEIPPLHFLAFDDPGNNTGGTSSQANLHLPPGAATSTAACTAATFRASKPLKDFSEISTEHIQTEIFQSRDLPRCRQIFVGIAKIQRP